MHIGSTRGGMKRRLEEGDPRPPQHRTFETACQTATNAWTVQSPSAQQSVCALQFVCRADGWPVAIDVTGATDEECRKACALVRSLMENAFPGMTPKVDRQECGWTVQAPLHGKAAKQTRRMAGALQACAETARRLTCGSDLVEAILNLPCGPSIAAMLSSGAVTLEARQHALGVGLEWKLDRQLPPGTSVHAAALASLLMRQEGFAPTWGAQLLWILIARATGGRQGVPRELRDALIEGANRQPRVRMSASTTQWSDLLHQGLKDGLPPDKQATYAALAHTLRREAQQTHMTVPDALAALTEELPLHVAEANQKQQALAHPPPCGMVDVTALVTEPGFRAITQGPPIHFERSWNWLLSAWREQQGPPTAPGTDTLFTRTKALQDALFVANPSTAVPMALTWARELAATHPHEAVKLLHRWPSDEETGDPYAVVERITLYVQFLRAHPSDDTLRQTVTASCDDVLAELEDLDFDDNDALVPMALLWDTWKKMRAEQSELDRAHGRDDRLGDFAISWPEGVEVRLDQLLPHEPEFANAAPTVPQSLPKFELCREADILRISVQSADLQGLADGQLLLRHWLQAVLSPARGPWHIDIEGECVRVAPADAHAPLDADTVQEAVRWLLACVRLAEMLGGGRSMLDALALHPQGPAIAQILARDVVRPRCTQDPAAATVVHWDLSPPLPEGVVRMIAQLSVALSGHGKASAATAIALLDAALQLPLPPEIRQHLQLAALRLASSPAELTLRFTQAAATLEQLPLQWDAPTLDDWIGTMAEVLTRLHELPQVDNGELLARARAQARHVIDRWLQQEASTQLDPSVLKRLVWPGVRLAHQHDICDDHTANGLILLYQHAVAHPQGREVAREVLMMLRRLSGEAAERARAACADIDASAVKEHLARHGFAFVLRLPELEPQVQDSFNPSIHADDLIEYGLLVMEDLCTSVARFVASHLPQLLDLPMAPWTQAAKLMERAMRLNVAAPPQPGDPMARELIAAFKLLQAHGFRTAPKPTAAMSLAWVQLLETRYPEEALHLLEGWPDKAREDAAADHLRCHVSLLRLHPDNRLLRETVLQAKTKVKEYLDQLAAEFFNDEEEYLTAEAQRQRMQALTLRMRALAVRQKAGRDLWTNWCLLEGVLHVRAPRMASDFKIELGRNALAVAESAGLHQTSIVGKMARVRSILDELEHANESDRQQWVEDLAIQAVAWFRAGGTIDGTYLPQMGLDWRELSRNIVRQLRLANREDLVRKIPIDWRFIDCGTWDPEEANFLLRSHLNGDSQAKLAAILSLPLRANDKALLARCEEWLAHETLRWPWYVMDVVERLLGRPSVLSDPGADAAAACRQLAQQCVGVLGPLMRYEAQVREPVPGTGHHPDFLLPMPDAAQASRVASARVFTQDELRAAFSSLQLLETRVQLPLRRIVPFFKPPHLADRAGPLSANARAFRHAFLKWLLNNGVSIVESSSEQEEEEEIDLWAPSTSSDSDTDESRDD